MFCFPVLMIPLIVQTGMASYDKTVVINSTRPMRLQNLNTFGVPISDRKFIHLNIKSCSGFYVSFQSQYYTWDDPAFIAMTVELNALIVLDCVTPRSDSCQEKPVKVVQIPMFKCNESFLLRADWIDRGGNIKISIGKVMDDQGRKLISKGTGPEVKEVLSFDTLKHFDVNYIGVGRKEKRYFEVSATYATILPHNDSTGLFLEVAENATVGTVLYDVRLARFHPDETVTVVENESNPDVVSMVNFKITLMKTVDFEQRSVYKFIWILQGDVLHLVLHVTLHVTDVSEHAPGISLRRPPEIVEELPEGTILQDFLNVTDQDANDSHIFRLLGNNSYLEMNSTTGEMRVRRRMDRDGYHGVRMMELVVEVSDGVFTTVFTFNITVIDLNDNRPTFDKSYYQINLAFSDISKVHFLSNFTITDLDEDEEMGFDTTLEVDETDVFYMQNLSLYARGNILKNVRRLQSRDWVYVFRVKATDKPKGGTPLTGETLVHLTIEPPPVIDPIEPIVAQNSSTIFHEMPTMKISENVEIGYVILNLRQRFTSLKMLTHHEYDIFSNDYECKNGNFGTDYMGIDQYSGDVVVGRRLDADPGGCSSVKLFFNVIDLHTGTSTTFASINIQVTNTDDELPRFNETVARVKLQCGPFNERYTILASLELTDVESGADVAVRQDTGHHFVYTLTNNRNIWSLNVDTDSVRHVLNEDVDIVYLVATNTIRPSLTSMAMVEVSQDCEKLIQQTSTDDSQTTPLKKTSATGTQTSSLKPMSREGSQKPPLQKPSVEGSKIPSLQRTAVGQESPKLKMGTGSHNEMVLCNTFATGMSQVIGGERQRKTGRRAMTKRHRSNRYDHKYREQKLSALKQKQGLSGSMAGMWTSLKQPVMPPQPLHLPDSVTALGKNGIFPFLTQNGKGKSGLNRSCCDCNDIAKSRGVLRKSTTGVVDVTKKDNRLAIGFLVFLLLLNIIVIGVIVYSRRPGNDSDTSEDD